MQHADPQSRQPRPQPPVRRLLVPAEDLEPGMFVTVHSAARSRRRGMLPSGAMPMPVPILVAPPEEFPVQPGVPLQVLEVSLPFVCCGVLQPGGEITGPALIDLRRVRLARVREAFVEAIRGFGRAAEPDTRHGAPTSPDLLEELGELPF